MPACDLTDNLGPVQGRHLLSEELPAHRYQQCETAGAGPFHLLQPWAWTAVGGPPCFLMVATLSKGSR